jgi:hypothetical protein
VPVEQLIHNRQNSVTGGIWREDGVIHKTLTHPAPALRATW